MDTYLQDIVSNHCVSVVKFFEENQENLYQMVSYCEARLKNGGKILTMGNGGSASDSAHFTAELLGRFEKERKALAAIDLTSSNATITAISNDYGYENVFSRQVEALAKDSDILIGISTSGTSKNVLKAFSKTRETGLETLNILLTSQRLPQANVDELLKYDVDYIFQVPHDNTARIQECHLMFLHVLAQLIENRFA
jgi:D-sedoheptulose 7-phosphate isomerase